MEELRKRHPDDSRHEYFSVNTYTVPFSYILFYSPLYLRSARSRCKSVILLHRWRCSLSVRCIWEVTRFRYSVISLILSASLTIVFLCIFSVSTHVWAFRLLLKRIEFDIIEIFYHFSSSLNPTVLNDLLFIENILTRLLQFFFSLNVGAVVRIKTTIITLSSSSIYPGKYPVCRSNWLRVSCVAYRSSYWSFSLLTSISIVLCKLLCVQEELLFSLFSSLKSLSFFSTLSSSSCHHIDP